MKQSGLAEQAVVFHGACTAQHPKQYFCLISAGYLPQEQTCHGAYEEQAQDTAATCAAHHPATSE